MDPSGKVTVLSGAAPQGHSYETVTAQLIVDVLGLELEDITVIHGDTQICPYGLGSYSSRFSVILAPAILQAANEIRSKLLHVAATFLGEEISDRDLKDSEVVSRKSGSKLRIADLARRIYTSALLHRGMSPGIETTVPYNATNTAGANGDSSQNLYLSFAYAAAAVVDVDRESGKINLVRYCIVHDCGNIIN